MAEETETMHIVTVKTGKCPFTTVTVYKDRAQVGRSVKAHLKSGVNEIHMTEFVKIEEDSIRVEGKGSATIVEVSFKSDWVKKNEVSVSEKERILQDKLKALEEEIKNLNFPSKKAMLQKQWIVLDRFSETATGKRTVLPLPQGASYKEFELNDSFFKGMQDFMKEYRTLGERLEKELFELVKIEAELNESIRVTESSLNSLQGDRFSSLKNRECIIVVDAQKETEVLLEVSYVVRNAHWIPSYDLRMFTDQGLLKLCYYGLISQSTGEDWEKAKLFLSTAEPGIGGAIPVLPITQLSISKYRLHVTRSHFTRPDDIQHTLRMAGDFLEGSAGRFDSFADEPMLATPVEVADKTTSTSYEIARQSTIPSDNNPHKVTVAILDLKPTMTYVTIPKVFPQAFLQAKINNTSPYMLLAGDTNIFLDNSFVAKADIKSVAPKEEFTCSLGVDPSVRVTYKPVIKMQSYAGLILKSTITTYEQIIEVNNLHDYDISILLKDSLPRSNDEKIKVTLITPPVDPKYPAKTKDVKLTKSNAVEWNLEIKACSMQEVIFKYSVEHPQNEELTTTDVQSS